MNEIPKKSRFYAYFFSIILPGLGQIYLDHEKRGFMILAGAVTLSVIISFFFAFPLNWIIMVGYWIWQVFDAFFLYYSQKEVNSENPFGEPLNVQSKCPLIS